MYCNVSTLFSTTHAHPSCVLPSSPQSSQASTEGGVGKEGPQSEDTDGRPNETAAAGATGPAAAANGAVRWYERAYDYWEDGQNCPPDDDGVLGGYGHISPTDVAGSGAFLDELQSMRPLLGNTNAAGGVVGGDAAVRICADLGRGGGEGESVVQAACPNPRNNEISCSVDSIDLSCCFSVLRCSSWA